MHKEPSPVQLNKIYLKRLTFFLDEQTSSETLLPIDKVSSNSEVEQILDFLEKDKYRIVGNLPYNISTQIILMFSNWSHVVGDLHFLVQKEVAEKIAGKIASKNWGKLSIKLSAFFNTEILFDVPPEAFDIKPKVNSSFIRMTPQKKYNIFLVVSSILTEI